MPAAAQPKVSVRELAKRTRLGFVLENFGGGIGKGPGNPAGARSPIDPLLKGAGLYMVGAIQRSFTDQRRGRFAWRERAVPNLAGVIRDLSSGGRIKPRRFDRRPALIDTGLLRGSIAFRRLTDGTVGIEVGTAIEYANRMQRGGKETLRVTQAVRDGLAKEMKKLRRRRQRAVKAGEFLPGAGGREALLKRLGFLFAVDEVEVSWPARPYVIVTDEDVRALNAMAREWILRDGPAGRSPRPAFGG